MTRAVPALLLACAAAACVGPPDEGGQTGEEFPVPCLETRLPVDDGETAQPLGFSPAEARAALSGVWAGTLWWTEGGEVGLSVEVGDPGDPAVLVRSEPNPAGNPLLEVCEDYLELPVTLGFATDDGAFDELFEPALRVTATDRAVLQTGAPADALAGSWLPPDDVDPADFDPLSLLISGVLGPPATQGEVALWGSRAGPEGGGGPEYHPVAAWDVAPPESPPED